MTVYRPFVLISNVWILEWIELNPCQTQGIIRVNYENSYDEHFPNTRVRQTESMFDEVCLIG